MPVSRSPVPPVAMPGLPVRLMNARSSGAGNDRAMSFEHDVDAVTRAANSGAMSQPIVLDCLDADIRAAAPSRPDAA